MLLAVFEANSDNDAPHLLAGAQFLQSGEARRRTTGNRRILRRRSPCRDFFDSFAEAISLGFSCNGSRKRGFAEDDFKASQQESQDTE